MCFQYSTRVVETIFESSFMIAEISKIDVESI